MSGAEERYAAAKTAILLLLGGEIPRVPFFREYKLHTHTVRGDRSVVIGAVTRGSSGMTKA